MIFLIVIISLILGFLFGRLYTTIATAHLIAGTIIMDKNDSLFVELDDDNSLDVLNNERRKFVIFRIKRIKRR